MRICSECNTGMLDMKFQSSQRFAVVVRAGENDKNVGTVACSVCPKCGKISLHLEDMTKLTNYLNK